MFQVIFGADPVKVLVNSLKEIFMKWVPLTDATISQLRSSGYTHLVVRRFTEIEEVQSEREYITLEAVKNAEQGEMNAIPISLEDPFVLLDKEESSYYVFYK